MSVIRRRKARRVRLEQPDLAALSWKDLQALARERGVYRIGMKRADVLAALA